MQSRKTLRTGRIGAFATVFREPRYIAIALLGAIAYYFVYFIIIRASNYGIFLITVPLYLIYAIAATSGILLALSAFSIAKSLLSLKAGTAGGIASAFIPSVGSMVATCACSYPILGSFLFFLGVNAFELSSIVSVISQYELEATFLIVVVNMLLLFYYSGRIARAEGLKHAGKSPFRVKIKRL
jgi:hypothetical protein